MDLDALRRAAAMLASGEAKPEHLVRDDLQTVEQEFDDMPPLGSMDTPRRPMRLPPEIEGMGDEDEGPGQPDDENAISDEELAGLIEREIEAANTFLESEIQRRGRALDYYFGRAPEQPAQDRSGVVSKDVADMTEAMLAQVLSAFEGDSLANFPPVDQEDEELANQESSYLNWVFLQECNGGDLMYTSFKDAMVRALGVGKVYWRQQTRIKFDEYHDLMPMEVQQALQPQHDDEIVDVVGAEEGQPQQAPMPPQAVQPGMPPPQPQMVPTVSIRVRRRWTEEQPDSCSVDPDNFLFSTDHASLYLSDVKFCAERRIIRQSDLIDMGFDEEVVEALPTYSYSDDVNAAARSKDGMVPTDFDQHVSTRPIEVYECYYLVDRDGDGYAERIKVWWSNRQVLEVEETDAVPYALCSPFPIPHKVIGESVYDKIKQVQDVKTALLRIAIDNALVNTFGRYEAEERMVNMKDLLSPKAGGAVRSKRIGSVAALPMLNVGDAPMNLMNYMDKVRSEGAGPALDMQRENLPVNVSTAHGTERVMSAMEQLVSRMAVSFADTFLSEIYRLLHNLMMKHGKGELQAQMPSGQFLITNPRNWRERDRVSISIGKTQGEKMRIAAALENTFQKQAAMMQSGGDGVLVDLGRVHNTLVDLGRASNLPSPEQYWIDPMSPESQNAQQQKAQQAQAAQQAQQQQMQMLLQLQQQLQMMQEETKRMKAQMDSQAKAAELASKNIQHAEDNAIKLTELELTQRQQANAEYQDNLRTVTQSQARTAQPRSQ